MLLLNKGAQPELPDSEGRTAKDFASISPKIWPFFASLDFKPTPRNKLVKSGILKEVFVRSFCFMLPKNCFLSSLKTRVTKKIHLKT